MSTVRLRGSAAAAGIATAILAAAPAAAQQLAYTGSAQFATGDYYFAERTSTFYLISGLTGEIGRLGFTATVPVIFQSTPWVSYTGMGMPLPSGGSQSSEVRRGMGGRMRDDGAIELQDTTTYEDVGIGDPLAHLGIEVLRESRAAPSVRLTFDVKAPLADVDRGFGTGEWDYAAGFALSKEVGGAFVFADASYWRLGDLSDLELKDAVAYGLAVGRPLGSGGFAVLVSLSGYTEIIQGVDPPVQAALGVNHLIGDGRSLNGTLSVGLTESASDISLGFGWWFGL